VPPDFQTLSEAELAALDTLLAESWPDGPDKWQSFYADRARPCPFFVPHPDECLVQWLDAGELRPGRALDIGCGNGRNSIFLARRGFDVDGIDVSESALAWANEQAADAGAEIAFHCRSFFELDAVEAYDLVYDGGCFHHIAPHRRDEYIRRVTAALKPGGTFGLVCFTPEGGSGYTDDEVYERRSLGGGLGYDEARLRSFWGAPLEIEVLRRMHEQAEGAGPFGKSFLWVMRARRRV
jgi:SAM-dependent methyltransferase